MTDRALEWLRQAEYDLSTAEFMAEGGRHFYAVFMCHLSLEKALKGLYHRNLNKVPPKVHNLVYLMTKVEAVPPEPIGRFIVTLNEASVSTRYPDSLSTVQREFTETVAKDILRRTKEALQWIKAQF